MHLRILLGDHPGTAALKNGSFKSDLVAFDFADYSPTNKGFKPMVRDGAFDVSEMAIVTYLMAKSFGKPMVLLPDVVLARFQHGHALYNAKARKSAGDLNGKRVGIRSVTTTTGACCAAFSPMIMGSISTLSTGSRSRTRMSPSSLTRPGARLQASRSSRC